MLISQRFKENHRIKFVKFKIYLFSQNLKLESWEILISKSILFKPC
jgi:hypothetical protein